MAVLGYNGVYLPFCDVTSFDMKAVMDESGTDKMLTKFDIQVRCLVTADAIDMIAPAYYGRTGDPAVIMALVQEALLKPKQRLTFQFGDFEFIPQPAGVRGFVDAANGPFPQNCAAVKIDEQSWWVQYHVIAHYVVSYAPQLTQVQVGVDAFGNPIEATTRITMTNNPGNPVISNRWEESVDIDEEQFSTRTRSGLIVIRSDNLEGLTADEVRSQMAVVSVPRGFTRKKSTYTIDPTGLKMRYVVVDQERYNMPPPGAYKASGDYTEQSSRGDGKRIASCHVSLTGNRNSRRSDLMRTALAVCAGKVNMRVIPRALNGRPLIGQLPGQNVVINNDSGGILASAISRHSLYAPRVSVTLTVQLPPHGRNRVGGAGGPLFDRRHVDVTPLSPTALADQDYVPPAFDRGTAGLLLQTALYYDPAIRGVQLGAVGDAFNPGGSPATPVGPQGNDKHQLTGGASLPGQAGRRGQ